MSDLVIVEKACRVVWSGQRSCYYKHLALIRKTPGYEKEIKMISTRAKGVEEIISHWGPYPARGRTLRSERGRALLEAQMLKQRLESSA